MLQCQNAIGLFAHRTSFSYIYTHTFVLKFGRHCSKAQAKSFLKFAIYTTASFFSHKILMVWIYSILYLLGNILKVLEWAIFSFTLHLHTTFSHAGCQIQCEAPCLTGLVLKALYTFAEELLAFIFTQSKASCPD